MTTARDATTFLASANGPFIEELYGRYVADASAVDADWAAFFEELQDEAPGVLKALEGASWSPRAARVITRREADGSPAAAAAIGNTAAANGTAAAAATANRFFKMTKPIFWFFNLSNYMTFIFFYRFIHLTHKRCLRTCLCSWPRRHYLINFYIMFSNHFISS